MEGSALSALWDTTARLPPVIWTLSAPRFSPYLTEMSILRIAVLGVSVALTYSAWAQDDLDKRLVKSSADQTVRDSVKSPELSVVHLWAPWCSNCQAELKNGGWLKKVKNNPQGKFYFVFGLDDGGGGKNDAEKVPKPHQTEIHG